MIELKNQRCDVFYDKLKFIYIELPKFEQSIEELESQFDKWLFVFRHLSDLQDRPKKLQDKIFTKLFEAAEVATFSPEERNVIDTSRREGREEERIKIAKALKQSGVDLETIQKVTGLTREEIEQF